jgi:hypothetical protein
MPPTPLAEERREAQDHRGEAGRQAQHGGISWRGHASLAGHPLRRLKPGNGQTRAKLDFARVGPEPERQAFDFPGAAQPERPFAASRGRRGERRNPALSRSRPKSSLQSAESTRKSGAG